MAEKSRNGKVTVVGAGFYGSTTALRLAEYDIFETVVLTDIVEGKPEGIALDMNQSRPIEGFETTIVGVGGGSYEGTGTIVSPCEPRVRVCTELTGTPSSSATLLVNRAVSSMPA